MSNDDLLMEWRDQKNRLATLEAALITAVDLLIEWFDDDLDTDAVPRLRAATRVFLLNTPIGTRSRTVPPLPESHPDSARPY